MIERNKWWVGRAKVAGGTQSCVWLCYYNSCWYDDKEFLVGMRGARTQLISGHTCGLRGGEIAAAHSDGGARACR